MNYSLCSARLNFTLTPAKITFLKEIKTKPWFQLQTINREFEGKIKGMTCYLLLPRISSWVILCIIFSRNNSTMHLWVSYIIINSTWENRKIYQGPKLSFNLKAISHSIQNSKMWQEHFNAELVEMIMKTNFSFWPTLIKSLAIEYFTDLS